MSETLYSTIMFSESGTKLLILDGGLGTTLEDQFGRKISNTPLWSAKPINEDPETIIEAHLAFLDAGARVLLTSSYQCAFKSFSQAGYTRDEARDTMLKSVSLAAEARSRFQTDGVKVALSLGPYGAICVPAREFDGIYPPPYGPPNNINTFGPGEEELDEKAIRALSEFHLTRLLVFATHSPTWKKIDCIAFETIPLLREITAIRRAVRALYEQNPAVERKPWWISTVYPDGRFPQGCEIGQVVDTALREGDGERPDGLGVNCTSTNLLADVLSKFTLALPSNLTPWLVAYPNGGDVYDPVAREWTAGTGAKGDGWATELVNIVENYTSGDVWGGVIVGGCCRTGPKEISALASKLNTRAS